MCSWTAASRGRDCTAARTWARPWTRCGCPISTVTTSSACRCCCCATRTGAHPAMTLVDPAGSRQARRAGTGLPGFPRAAAVSGGLSRPRRARCALAPPGPVPRATWHARALSGRSAGRGWRIRVLQRRRPATPATAALARSAWTCIRKAYGLDADTPGHGGLASCLELARQSGARRLALVHLSRPVRRAHAAEIRALLAGNWASRPPGGPQVVLA